MVKRTSSFRRLVVRRLRKMRRADQSDERKRAVSERIHFGQAAGRHVLPFFAAGYGFSSHMFDALVCQAFYNPPVLKFIKQLVAPSPRCEGEPPASYCVLLPITASMEVRARMRVRARTRARA